MRPPAVHSCLVPDRILADKTCSGHSRCVAIIGEHIQWLEPTDWLSVPVDGNWFSLRFHHGLAGLKRALGLPTNDIFIIQGTHAGAVMEEEHESELFDSSVASTP
jgi:hypothetical protein